MLAARLGPAACVAESASACPHRPVPIWVTAADSPAWTRAACCLPPIPAGPPAGCARAPGRPCWRLLAP
eukprot:9497314-Pyramimonas_sp.AAC.1